MAKRLRKRIIWIATMVLFVTLVVTFGLANLIIRHSMSARLDSIIDLIYENDGNLPSIIDKKDDDFTAETPYQTRYYVAWIGEDGTFVHDNSDNITVDSVQFITRKIGKILNLNKEYGYYSNYRYRIYSEKSEKILIMIDASSELSTVNTLLGVTFYIISMCVIIVFVLIMLFSKYAVKPFIENQKRQKQFITDAGHELKTPIAIIQSNAEVIEMMSGESQWITNIKNQTTRMNKLVKSMIELSKMDEQVKLEDEKQDVNLSEIVNETVDSFFAIAEKNQVCIKKNIDTGILVNAYLEDMVRLSGILVDNALKYVDDRKEVKVSLTKKTRKIVLEVTNSCKNIDKVSIDKMFDRFYRADTSRSSERKGYGIGLAMAKMIVKRNRGKIGATCTKDDYITFWIEI